MSFRLRTMLCIVMLLALTFGAGGSMLISLSFRESLENEQDTAIKSYRMIENTMVLANSISLQSELTDLGSTLRQLDEQSDTQWSVLQLSSDASVLYRSGSLPYDSEDTGDWEEGQCHVRLYREDGVSLLQVSGILQVNRQTLYLAAAYDVSDLYELRDSQLAIYYRLLLAVVLVGAVMSWAMAAYLTRPLYKLSRVTREIAGGNYASRADIRSGDEFQQLAEDFNRMTDQVEENIVQLQDAMRRQEEFMGSFAHELKTPMTSIIGYADLIRSQSLSPEEEQQAANYIFSEGRRLESLSLKLLDLLVLKKRDFSLTEGSPAAVIRGLVHVLRPSMAEQGVTLQCRCQEGRCLMDADLVKSLVINLADNARKAMDGPGNIYILSEMTDTGCRIRVADNGRGMPEAELTRITEAFYRVDKSRSRAQGGAGLGLALCQEIAALHGGSLSFRSKEGQGTIVTAELNGGRV
ncbi:MAG: HAMP domain-containing histidine kinase [Oscillospiraceae bacterium]|nr:HAMP domain-containing histidine kinase [Oscillospiraceae bacterium]